MDPKLGAGAPVAVLSALPLAAAAGALALAAWSLGSWVRKHVRSMDVPVIRESSPVLQRLQFPVHASHRGGAKAWPENTVLAFREASTIPWRCAGEGPSSSAAQGGGAGAAAPGSNPLSGTSAPQKGTRMIELDVQLSKDGHLVVIHNLTVDSTTNGTGRVKDLTLKQLRALDAAYCFSQEGPTGVREHPYRGKGERIPLLSEVLELMAPQHDIILYLDFKAADAIPPALAMAARYGLLKDRVVVGAVPPEANRALLKLKPASVPATPDINTMIALYVAYCLGFLWLVPLKHEIVGTTAHRWGMKVLTRGLVEAFHKRGRLLAVFGDHIDSEAGQRDCLDLGCDFLVSDQPDVLWRTMQSWREQRTEERKEGTHDKKDE